MSNDKPQTDESEITYEVGPGESLSEGVVKVVSSFSNQASTPTSHSESETDAALDPLYSAIDPDALNAVFQQYNPDTDQPSGQVTFSYQGHQIVACSDGRIAVKPSETFTNEASD